jgi:phospholipid/cholesterol/gamma-HCH transport system ATP-binding protein
MATNLYQTQTGDSKPVLLSLEGLKKSLGSQKVLTSTSLKILEGEKLVIIGRSGCGKSVLLRHIIGLMHPDEGRVMFKGTDLTKLGEEALNPYRRQIGMLFQGGALFDSMTVEDNLAFPLREANHISEKEIKEKVESALEWVNLPGQEKKMPAALSGGMKKRVALARAVISRPDLMLYDEPTTGLDPIVSDSINHLILGLSEKLKMAAIVVTHDMTSAYMIADRIAYLHEGKIYFNGTPEEIRNSRDPLVQRFVRGISEEQELVI